MSLPDFGIIIDTGERDRRDVFPPSTFLDLDRSAGTDRVLALCRRTPAPLPIRFGAIG